MPFLGKFQQVFQLTWSSQFFKSFRPQYRILTDANVTENLMQFQNRLITHVLFTPSGAISVPSNVIFLLKALETKCIFWKLCWFVSFLSRRDGNPHIPQNCRSRLNLTMTHDACGLCNSQQFKSFHIWVSTCSVVSELSWQSKPTFPFFAAAIGKADETRRSMVFKTLNKQCVCFRNYYWCMTLFFTTMWVNNFHKYDFIFIVNAPVSLSKQWCWIAKRNFNQLVSLVWRRTNLW